LKTSKGKTDNWFKQMAGILPGFESLVSNLTSPTLVVGAAVLEFYAIQEWIAPLSRKTGDLDLSVGIRAVSGLEYLAFKKKLLTQGYENKDRAMPYRFWHTSKIPGAMAYIDLLAYPENPKVKEETVRRLMGVGAGFSLAGFVFASERAFEISPKLFVPNPIAFMRLKMESYKDDPIGRKRDFADIVELVLGLVATRTHFELGDFCVDLPSSKDKEFVFDVLSKMENDSSSTWDIDDIKSELRGRNFWLAGDNFEQTFRRALEALRETCS
jgi:hypothetical protein